jgi:glutamate/tyrosine decarboxylase-like PLP-dependent enzyme
MAEVAEAAIRELSTWEVVTPAQMGIVTFRCIPAGLAPEKLNGLNRELVEEVIADGFAMVSSTVLRGQTVLRMCTINPRTAEADVRETIKRLDDISKRLLQ